MTGLLPLKRCSVLPPLSKILISSVHNDLVRTTVRLHESKGRDAQKAFLVEGARACTPFLEAGWKPVLFWVTTEHSVWALEQGVPESVLYIATEAVMQKISIAMTPSGVIGVFAQPNLTPSPQLEPGVVLANIRDPGNVGTLIRTARAFNFAAFVVDGVDLFSPKVVQATAGALAQGHVFRLSWENLVKKALESQAHLCAMVVSGGTPLSALPAHPCRLLVVGNEAHGLPPAWVAACQEQTTIPMYGATESLNAGVAGAIALYELSQNRFTST